MTQIILTNGKACTGMFDFSPGNGMRYMGDVSLSEISQIQFTKNILDNPAVENALRERYGFGENLPAVQTKYNPKTHEYEKDYRAYIEQGDVVYSIVSPEGEKIHAGKISGESLPTDLKLRVLKYVGD